jgi:HPt (histidine-containing phosphotransfer) domain-containing protein
VPAVTLDPSYLLAAIGSPPRTAALQALEPLCDLFLQEMHVRIDALRDASLRHESIEPDEDVAFIVHTFCGSASNFGAMRLVEIASELDQDADWFAVDRVVRELGSELNRVERALRELVTAKAS